MFLYSGNYGDSVTLESLKDFHRRRLQILATSGADLIAFETIPNKLEAQVFANYWLGVDIFNSCSKAELLIGHAKRDTFHFLFNTQFWLIYKT